MRRPLIHRVSALITVVMLALVSTLVAPSAMANPQQGDEDRAEEAMQSPPRATEHKLTLTMSPAHLTLPFLELMGEFSLSEDI